MAAAAPVTVGLASAEMVLRGGYLRSPIVLQRLKVVEGKQFVYLTKTGGGSVVLARFLTKEAPRKRPLAKTAVFESIAKLRDAAYRNFAATPLGAATALDEAAATPLGAATAFDDPCEALGLDDDVEQATEQRTRPRARKGAKKRLHKKDQVAVPPTAEVCYERPGQTDWKFHVLLEGAAKCPAIEATQANLQMLFTLVDDDVMHGATRRARHGVATASTRPAPRGPAGRRSYAIHHKWVTKISEPREPGDETPTKKVKTLKRRRTGDAGTPPPRAKAKSSSSLAKALQDQLDCLAVEE